MKNSNDEDIDINETIYNRNKTKNPYLEYMNIYGSHTSLIELLFAIFQKEERDHTITSVILMRHFGCVCIVKDPNPVDNDNEQNIKTFIETCLNSKYAVKAE